MAGFVLGLIAGVVAGYAIGAGVAAKPQAPAARTVRMRGYQRAAKSPYFTETPAQPVLLRGNVIPKERPWPRGAKSPYFTETPAQPALFRGKQETRTQLSPAGGPKVAFRAGMLVIEGGESGAYFTETPTAPALFKGGQWPHKGAGGPYKVTPLFEIF